MATLVRIRRLHRMPLRIGKVNVSNSALGSVIDLDDAAVRRDLRNKSQRYVFVDNEPANGAVIENMSALDASDALAPTSQKLRLSKVDIPAGFTVTSLTWVSGSTAAATSSHAWAALFKVSGANVAAVAVSADDTAASPWSANTAKTFNVFTTGTTKYIGENNATYYAGVVLQATTQPTLCGVTLGSSALNTLAGASLPLTGGENTATRTTPIATATTIAISDLSNLTTHVPYVRVA